ncbi:radical SAM family heme chaperone HemW [bacterium]|nr:radical SAM family heme chaperone HemW [bacterium]
MHLLWQTPINRGRHFLLSRVLSPHLQSQFAHLPLPQTNKIAPPGIYLHIPYCRQACSYCNFYFSTGLKSEANFVDALCTEMRIKQKFWPERTAATLYFGGGSPSILSATSLHTIFENLHQNFDLSNVTEVTFECNPDDITEANLKLWKKLGINRLSIGIQSFDDQDLKLLNRVHNSQQAIGAIQKALDAGFTNLTIDYIYGIPGKDNESMLAQLDYLQKFNIPHFSAYALTVEPKTLLHHQVAKGMVKPVADESYLRQYELIKQFAEAQGYEHYEISNFAKPGFKAQHNTNYWYGLPYLGLGPSAHSFVPGTRSWNVANTPAYIKAIKNETPFYESEILSEADQYNEYIITLIRTARGLSLAEINTRFEYFKPHFSQVINSLVAQQLVYEKNQHFILTHQGEFLCDYISTQLMFDPDESQD